MFGDYREMETVQNKILLWLSWGKMVGLVVAVGAGRISGIFQGFFPKDLHAQKVMKDFTR